MRLLNPDPGEMYDRLTILAWKIEEAMLQEKESMTINFQKEFNDLLHKLKLPEKTRPMLQLASVNGLLREDMNRLEFFVNSRERLNAGLVGERIVKLNKRRASLVAKINGRAVSQEKL